jgi:LmbE family N-acetylglucosaminyl deacetylase
VNEESQILKEASLALARLDADRLEELAAACRVLNRDLPYIDTETRDLVQLEDCLKALKVLGRIVEKTRYNLEVVRRVQARSRGAHALDALAGAGPR